MLGPIQRWLSACPLNDIDPANIVSVEVVKGASATSLYGTARRRVYYAFLLGFEVVKGAAAASLYGTERPTA